MASLWRLPDELLLEVISYFLLDDLQSLAVTNRYFRNLSQNQLERHKQLKRKYYKLDDDAQQHPTGWLTPLLALLKDDYPPSYTEVVRIERPAWYWHELPYFEQEEHQHDTPGQQTSSWENDMKLVIKAVESSPWIPESEPCGPRTNAKNRAHFIAEIREGDQDNILAILLPLLPNLQRLQLPAGRRHEGLGSVPGVVSQIARATDAAISAGEPIDDLPLSKLSCICTSDARIQHLDFEDVAPFMSLPSVSEVDMLNVTQEEFEWPATLPMSRASIVHCSLSYTPYPAIQGLASGMRGPCMIEASGPTPVAPPEATQLFLYKSRKGRTRRLSLEQIRLNFRFDLEFDTGNLRHLPFLGRALSRGMSTDGVCNIERRVLSSLRKQKEKRALLAGRNDAALLPRQEA